MPNPQVIILLRQNMLYLIRKGLLAEFDLSNYGFDARKEVSSGKGGNHFFKKNGPIKDISVTIEKNMSKVERLKSVVGLIVVSGALISDKPLNNLGIKHYCDFLEHIGCKNAIIYYDNEMTRVNMSYYIDHVFEYVSDEKMIGQKKHTRVSYWYKEIDTSIEQDELLSRESP